VNLTDAQNVNLMARSYWKRINGKGSSENEHGKRIWKRKGNEYGNELWKTILENECENEYGEEYWKMNMERNIENVLENKYEKEYGK